MWTTSGERCMFLCTLRTCERVISWSFPVFFPPSLWKIESWLQRFLRRWSFGKVLSKIRWSVQLSYLSPQITQRLQDPHWCHYRSTFFFLGNFCRGRTQDWYSPLCLKWQRGLSLTHIIVRMVSLCKLVGELI